MKKHLILKRIFICIAALLGILFILAALIYINLKNFTVKRLQSTSGQEVYLMGTFHKDHFEPLANYSIEEMLNAIENINPDAVFIEAREENYERYGVVDGPVDMCISYCYCQDNGIPVEMIDYWKVDNENYKTNHSCPINQPNNQKAIKRFYPAKVLEGTFRKSGRTICLNPCA